MPEVAMVAGLGVSMKPRLVLTNRGAAVVLALTLVGLTLAGLIGTWVYGA